LVIAADPQLLAERASLLNLEPQFETYSPDTHRNAHRPRCVRMLATPLAVPVEPGRLNRENARYVLSLLDRAIDGCVQGEFAAMVTAPVQKSVINEAGIAFTGHTEYIASRTSAMRPVMMLVADRLRVALATTHLPLRAVSDALSRPLLAEVLRVIDTDLRARFGIARPRILVCGLNPHAGEGGHLGREEIEVIAPAVQEARRAGIDASGPVPADTAFTPRSLASADVVLAMYHDQGLPVLKFAGFGGAVNVTLGLSLIRTSVDHGTALDLAGSGQADAGSLAAALQLAIELTQSGQLSRAALA
jgi:4-hydroxythreonine-4-phosphate dehydrogenase